MVGQRTGREVKVPNAVLISLLKTRLTFFGHEQFSNQVKVKYTRMPKPPGQSYSGSSMANILPAFSFPPSLHAMKQGPTNMANVSMLYLKIESSHYLAMSFLRAVGTETLFSVLWHSLLMGLGVTARLGHSDGIIPLWAKKHFMLLPNS